ncbi:MAG: hypothetical protein M5U01_10265 [Ardenticatenaceae bacterium]|nr:hypothetical protein [Ardenticatenaceae bacterium]
MYNAFAVEGSAPALVHLVALAVVVASCQLAVESHVLALVHLVALAVVVASCQLAVGSNALALIHLPPCGVPPYVHVLVRVPPPGEPSSLQPQSLRYQDHALLAASAVNHDGLEQRAGALEQGAAAVGAAMSQQKPRTRIIRVRGGTLGGAR